MSKLLIVIGIFVSVVDGKKPKIKFVEEGSEAVLQFSFYGVNSESEFQIDILHSNWIGQKVYRDSSFFITERIKVTLGWDGEAKMDIKNVSKSDLGQYCLSRRLNLINNDTNIHYADTKCIVLLTKRRNLPQYDQTLFLKDHSNVTLKFEDKARITRDWYMFIFQFLGTKWIRLDSKGRFHLSLGCDEYVPTIISNNITKDDEGIFWFVLISPAEFMYYGWKPEDPSLIFERSMRLLFKYLNFTKQNESFVTIGTNGDYLSLVCEINSDYQVKEMYIETKGVVMISGDPPMINYTFVPSKEDHLNVYKCSARIRDHPTTIDTTTRLVVHYVIKKELDHFLNISNAAAFILFLYIIVLQIVCCHQRKHLKHRINDTIGNKEYDEIETISYHSISIPPLPLRQPVSEFHTSSHMVTSTESDVIIETVNQISEIRRIHTDSTSFDGTFCENVHDNANLQFKNGIHNSDNTGNFGDIESTSNQIWNSGRSIPGDTINKEVKENSKMACSNDEIEGNSNQVALSITCSYDTFDDDVIDGSRKIYQDDIQNSHSVFSCDTFNQEVDIRSHHRPETEVRNSDTASADDTSGEDEENTSLLINQLPGGDINDSDITIVGDTSYGEVNDFSNQSPGNEHVYTEMLDIGQDEYNYSDLDITTAANQNVNVKRTEHYINLRI